MKNMPTLTIKQLQTYNGKNGNPPYVAINGEVYDLSSSQMWDRGEHAGLHTAGCDLTAALALAPHGDEVLQRMKKVGMLEPVPATARRSPPVWASKLIALHSHPIASHFPQAFFVFAPVFLMLFYLTGTASFERTAYHLLCVGLVMAVPAVTTGLVHWQFKFNRSSGPVFRLKIILSAVLLLAAGLVTAYHTACGRLAVSPVNWLLLLFYFSLVPIVTLLGRAGGQIVFGGKGR